MRDFIDFDQIDKHGPQPFGATLDITAEELDRDEVGAPGPVTIEGMASRGDRPGEYVLEGIATFTMDLKCSRCVDPYPFANRTPFHLRYRARPETAEAEQEEVEISPDELDIEFYSERQVTLRDLAVSQIQLSIPMKPLCEENCLGLCSGCGANRNRETCQCESAVGDERWGALRNIREELAKKRDS